ncbi:MAG: protoporphyrinogen oxidase [Candidatus Dormibacteria bacterium]
MNATSLHFAIVGGGVSGLAAARALLALGDERGREVEVSLFEASSSVGGRIASDTIAGVAVDLGAESLLAREESVWDLLSSLGLDRQALVPGTTSASLWNGRRMVPIPLGSALGVPPKPWSFQVLRALGISGAVRASLEPWVGHAKPDPDGPLGPFLNQRFGTAVFARLVDPLVGGVYAGSAAQLSIGAVAPQLLRALELDPSLLRGLRRQAAPRPARSAPSRPTFVSFPDGLGSLVEALRKGLPAGAVHLDAPVLEVLPAPLSSGIRLRLDGRADVDCDGVVLAIPAPEAAELVAGTSRELGDELRRQEWASVATVSLVYPESAFSAPLLGSGFLVPRSLRRRVTACTFMDRKWPHLSRPGQVLLRASVGSAGDDSILTRDDTTVISSVHNDLRSMVGISALPTTAVVRRWQPALPQYRAGHLAWRERAAGLAAALPMPVVLAGASYQGVGVAACLQSATAAARELFDRAQSRTAAGGTGST